METATTQRTVRDRLAEARRAAFQGRESELARLSALIDPEARVRVAFVHASGGTGKTTLLRAFEEQCQARDVATVRVDGRDVDPNGNALWQALDAALPRSDGSTTLEAIGAQPTVLLLDTFELLHELEDWLRREFIPALPDSARVCIAGRRPPSSRWSTDLGWDTLLDAIPLRNFDADDSRAFLERRNVAAERIPDLHRVTYGHPLALALAAEVAARSPLAFDGESERDVLSALLAHFQREIPDARHRRALQATAIARVTTESLLREMLDGEDVGELFEWLSDLSFMESGSLGLFPHDLIRDALVAELARRDPDLRRDFHGRARNYYLARLAEVWDHPIGNSPTQFIYDLSYLHRNNRITAGLFSWSRHEALAPGVPRAEEWAGIDEALQLFEGAESVRWAHYWAERQPESPVVVRDGTGRALGFAQLITLSHANARASAEDPATAAVWNYLENHAPLRGEECAIVTRFWLSLDRHQSVAPECASLFLHTLGVYFTKRNLAYSVALFHNVDFWAPGFEYMNFSRLREADFEIDGQTIGSFGHDWRKVDVLAWQNLLFDRELDPEAQRAPSIDEPLVLARPDFDAAVRDALKGWARAGGLADNPLMRSNLVRELAGGGKRPEEALREQILAAWEALDKDPSTQRAREAIRHTYIDPIGTQERVAERLHLPFSTYRRHLQRGIDSIGAALWEREATSGAPRVAQPEQS
jgi:hypothetical protein